MEKTKALKVIISGGGSGGHVYPAIAIANEIKRQFPDASVQFVGAKGKMEMEKVPKAAYPIEGLWISGFQRSWTLKNLSFPFKLVHSLWKARGIINRFKPDIAIGVGGYASFPTLAMAHQMGIPTMIQEQNSYAGVSNKMLKNKVQRICVAYDNLEKYFPKEKIVVTGNPVRTDIWENKIDRSLAKKHFNLNDSKKTILVFGGSLGARTLNNAVVANEGLIRQQEDLEIIWQCGKYYYQEFKDTSTAQLPQVRLLQFIDRMDMAYAAADIVISRAGALTISELCLVAKAAILIPSPNVTGDHQTKNAKALTEQEAALFLEDKDAGKMIEKAIAVLNDIEEKQKLEKNILNLAKPKAAEYIVNVMKSLIGIN